MSEDRLIDSYHFTEGLSEPQIKRCYAFAYKKLVESGDLEDKNGNHHSYFVEAAQKIQIDNNRRAIRQLQAIGNALLELD